MADTTMANYPGKLTQAAVTALPLLTIADFRPTLDYRVAEPVGAIAPADILTNPDWKSVPYFIMRTKTVRPATINQDLVEFQDYVRRNMAVAAA